MPPPTVPPPVWMLRLLPSLGMAAATAYVGYQVYQHVKQQQKQPHLQQQKQVDDWTTQASEQEDQERAQLCRWMGLDPNALQNVPNVRLTQCLEVLSYLPVSARPAFLTHVFNHLTDEQIPHYIQLLEERTAEQQETSVVLLSTAMPRYGHVCLRAGSIWDELYQVFLSSLSSSSNTLETLWKVLEQWQHQEDVFAAVLQTLTLPFEEPPEEEVPDKVHQENDVVFVPLPQEQDDEDDLETPREEFEQEEEEEEEVYTMDPVESVPPSTTTNETALLVSLLERLSDALHVNGLCRGVQLCPLVQRKPLLHKLHSWPEERLCPLLACWATFSEEATRELLHTLRLE